MEATILWAIHGHSLLVPAMQAPLAAKLMSCDDDMCPSSISNYTMHASLHAGSRRKATLLVPDLPIQWPVKADETFGIPYVTSWPH